VRTAAQKITARGDARRGLRRLQQEQHRGWHFTAELYAIGGEIATKDGSTWKAAFNSDKGKQVLHQLHDMR